MSLAVLLALVPACADDETTTGDGASGSARSNDEPVASGQATSQAADGRLTTPDGEVITDFGRPRDRRAAVRTLVRVQQDFRAARMGVACRRINDFMLSQFTPGRSRPETPCPQKLEAYAKALAARDNPPPPLRLLWVRAYTGETGIWVQDGDGKRLRIQLSSPPGEGWQLDLGSLIRPNVIASELSGADDYGN